MLLSMLHTAAANGFIPYSKYRFVGLAVVLIDCYGGHFIFALATLLPRRPATRPFVVRCFSVKRPRLELKPAFTASCGWVGKKKNQWLRCR